MGRLYEPFSRETAEYVIDSIDQHTLHIPGLQLNRSNYDHKYEVALLDQQVQGTIKKIEDGKILISIWEDPEENIDYYINVYDTYGMIACLYILYIGGVIDELC